MIQLTRTLLFTSLVASLACSVPISHAQSGNGKIVRVAEIEIDPQRSDQYVASLREEIEATIRLEPGVLTLYAVSVKGHPEQVRIFEVYASQTAYEAHLRTPHFLKYKSTTQDMVRSLKLVEAEPIILAKK